jgi:predicted RNA polymerase sigma factor
VTLYEGLLAIAPSTGARLAQAVAVARATGDAAAGLALLDTLDGAALATHQSWWAVRAHLLDLAGRSAEAAEAHWAARRLTTSPAVLGWFDARLAALGAHGH